MIKKIRNKRGDIPVTILVLGVVAICILAILSFFASSFEMKKNFDIQLVKEAKLAREADLEYATIAMVTDYDCWKKDEPPVSWDQIKAVMADNSERVQKVLLKTIESLSRK